MSKIAGIKALDIEQERFAKRINEGHYMVSGIPGSGKTVTLIARALHMLRENPEWKIRIVTYNKSLKNKMLSKIEKSKLEAEHEGLNIHNISISTFHKLALDVSGIPMPPYPSDEFWKNELPLRALERATPIFDAILIDEYQDFHENWIKLCLAVAKRKGEKGENIFLAGDRLQSIYNPGEIIWKNVGINIVGRSKLLKNSYRIGKKHIDLALKFLQKDPKLKQEVEEFYEGINDIETHDYDEEIGILKRGYEEVVDVIDNLLHTVGYNPEDILVLGFHKKNCEMFLNMLPPHIKRNSLFSKDIVDDNLVITTYHSSKGLESKICIMLDFHKLDSRKLAYVGMTRASEKIYIQASNFSTKNFATEILEMIK